MKRALILALIAACSAPAARTVTPIPETPPGADREKSKKELAQLMDLTARACDCPDQACLQTVDGELTALARAAHDADPDPLVDDPDPADLEAMTKATFLRMVACMVDDGYYPTTFGAIQLMHVESLRDAACACSDASCATRMKKLLEDWADDTEDSGWPVPADTQQQINATALDALACTRGPLAQQAILDLEQLEVEACACSDAPCAHDVEKKFNAWTKEHKDTKGDQTTLDKVADIAGELTECLIRAEAP